MSTEKKKDVVALPDRLPGEFLSKRTAMFLSMTQGKGKQYSYPVPKRG